MLNEVKHLYRFFADAHNDIFELAIGISFIVVVLGTILR
jgi:hypothetical protein